MFQMKENERRAMEEAKKDREILRNRVKSDKLVSIVFPWSALHSFIYRVIGCDNSLLKNNFVAGC